MTDTNDKNYGPNWIMSAFHTPLSTLGEDVARLLHDFTGGIYHIQRAASKVDWKNPLYIEINLYGGMATFDSASLTRLVFLAHDYAIRIEINGARNGILKLLFHRRDRDGDLYHRHPTLEDAVKQWRVWYPGDDND